jgi:steroid delta-isomerase-like uncharacterized protein
MPRCGGACATVRLAVLQMEMITEQPRSVVTRFLQRVYNERALDAAGEFVTPDYDPGVSMPQRGAEAARGLVQLFVAAFPDFKVEIADSFGDENKVVVRYRFSGTQQGTWAHVAPTGRAISIEGITIYEMRAGKIARTWFSYDALGILQQLGATSTSLSSVEP